LLKGRLRNWNVVPFPVRFSRIFLRGLSQALEALCDPKASEVVAFPLRFLEVHGVHVQ
jgi:hypothetical protein